MAYLSIRLLGGFQVDLNGVPVIDFKSDKVRALLAYLAVESGQPHLRDSLAWLLWPNSPNKVARTNLRSTLANLRKVVSDPNASPPHLLITRESIQFNNSSDHTLDVSEFMSATGVTEIDANQLEHLEKIVTLYRGSFLNGFSIGDSAPFEEWVAIKREQIDRQVMVILNSLAAYHEQQGEYEKAQTRAQQMVEIEPWIEEAHQQLMRVLALGGQRSAALAQYEVCRRVLAKELDVEPSKETTALYEAIREEKLDAVSILPSLKTTGIQISPASAQRDIFVGRETELEKLNSFLEKTLEGNGRVVFVTGSLGSGKTALIDEFVRCAMQTHRTLIPTMGRCSTYTGIGDPYLPFLEIIGLLTGDIEAKFSSGLITKQHARRLWALLPDAIQVVVEIGSDLLNRMVPGAALVNRARAVAHGHEPWLDKLEELVENHQADQYGENLPQMDLFEQFTRVLLALARRHPLILFVDDLQWADAGSISLLFHLGRHLRGSRILVVGAYRSEELALGRNGGQHPLAPLVLEFQHDFNEVNIDLDQSEGRDFVEAFLANEPNCLSLAFHETLFRQTSGQALFTIELMQSLQERGELIRDECGRLVEGDKLSWDKLPMRVEAVIAERMGRLPQKLRRILEVASVEGEEFTAEVVASVLNIGEGKLVQQLSEQLDRKHHLVAATQFRRLDGKRVSRYHFRHHLYQTYLYFSLLDEIERVYLHEAVGQTLERYFQALPEQIDVLAVQLAWHFQEAGLLNKAIDYLMRSGKRAECLSASGEAIMHLRHALDLCHRLPDTNERTQTELALSMALGAQLIASGGYSSVEVEQLYTRVGQLCHDINKDLVDPHKAAEVLIPVLLGLGAYYGHRAKYQAAREIYDQIFTLAQAAGDPELMMLAHWGPGYLLVEMGEFLSARDHLEKALETYDPDKHQRLITIFTLDLGVSCLSWLSCALFFLGYPDQALRRSGEAIVLARQISHPFTLAVALAVASLLHSWMLDGEGTQELADEAIEICREKGFSFWLSVTSAFWGLAQAWQGKYKEGIRQMREGERAWRASGAIIGLPEYLIVLAEVFGDAGQVEKGLSVLEETLEMINKSGETLYLAELHRIKGELLIELSHDYQDKAEVCYHDAIEIARQQQAKSLELRAMTNLSYILARQGKKDEARELLQNIYNWFTEGFDTQDLKSASNLLKELS